MVNNSGLTGDPTTAKVEIDRRMLDFCVGLDTEFSEIVEGSHLYYPKTKFDQVLSPSNHVIELLRYINFVAKCIKEQFSLRFHNGPTTLFHLKRTIPYFCLFLSPFKL